MSTRTVTVWGEKISIEIFEEHKTVWKAIGVYKGERIEVSGRNISEAVKLWRDAATYRGNIGSSSEDNASQN
jgi:hypothetical protein